ncbi:hypothetical protein [Marinobacter subterrani]|nr:hypothetical protein [Marinobacter subterrani]
MRADIGKLCYIVDNQTVAKTDATATRSVQASSMRRRHRRLGKHRPDNA